MSSRQYNMESYRIFIVEDDPWYGEILEYHLSLNPDYLITRFTTGKECLANMHKQPNLITIDFSLPDYTGDLLFQKIKEVNDQVPVIVISGQEEIAVAVKLLKMGVNDYLVKDENTKDILWNSVIKVRETGKLKSEVANLREELGQKFSFDKSIKGQSPALNKIFLLMEKATKTNINVSITGETGTGKEVVAKAIHYNGERRRKPFVAVNMAAIPKELIESELFGHEKGAFTSAVNQRKGKFEQAEGGTLFLDEIGDMSLSAQAKVLRALQENKISRVGGEKEIKVNVRVVAATNKNLKEEIQKGNFREDLYHRLSVIPIHVPSLNQRIEDIPLLAEHFVKLLSDEHGITPKKITKEGIAALQKIDWTGNIREFKNVIERLLILCDKTITDKDIKQYASKN